MGGRISLTFDDGNLSTYTEAFPLMKRAGLKGHIAVVTDFVGQPNRYSWDQIKEMTDVGWEVMSHSRTHDFKEMPSAKVRAEVVESKEILNQKGYPAKVFNIPGGSWSGRADLAEGSDFEKLVRKTYKAFLPDSDVHPMYDPIDPYHIGHLCCECYDQEQYAAPLPDIFRVVDEAAEKGAWCQLLWHDIQGRHVEKLREVLDYITPHVQTGRLACVTVSEALGI